MEILEELHFSNNYWEILLPLVLMVADIITGYYNAWKNKEISSSKMRDGLGKKIAELCYLFVSFIIGIAFDIKVVSYFISIYVIYMELISILENCEKLGVKMSDTLKEKLNNKKGE